MHLKEQSDLDKLMVAGESLLSDDTCKSIYEGRLFVCFVL
jgi:hypothetical protein